jgi:hypothetical protein
MTQPNVKHQLPHDSQVVVPLWAGCVLVRTVDPTGLVKSWHMIETSRWGMPPVVREVSRGYADQLFREEYPIPANPEPLPLSYAVSGEIDC